ncbi:MAG TPA: TlpA disulfide reductase family protein [Candidatus Didemnitutus sp.]|nr:TlpA disulfide reductase family protein [Candidatus Didemnitutus sp.]
MSWPEFIACTFRTRTIRLAAGVAALLLAVGLRAELKVGDAFPALKGVQADAALPVTAGHVTLIDFWASWCGPCKSSFPVYSRIQSDYAKDGLVVVGVSVDDSDAAYRTFVRRLAPTFVTAVDARHELAAHVEVPAMPTSYLLGRDGRVRYIHVGFHGAETEKQIRREIESLLAETPSSS